MRVAVTILFAVLFAVVTAAHSADTQKPRKVVLQLTDNSPEKQVLVLNVADNLVANYGDKITIEVVAFGPGLNLLFEENPNGERIASLAGSGVKFSACRSTVRKVSKLLGKEKSLNEFATEVNGGAQRIIELVQDGYILVRP